MSIKLLVADDHELVRRGLAAMLAGSGIEIAAEAATGEEAVRLALKRAFDVALLDVRMPGDGLAALARIRAEKPELPVLMFSQFDNPAFIARAVSGGANGYLLKTANAEEIRGAIQRVVRGQDAWTRDKLRRVTGAVAARKPSSVDVSLTGRESEILRHLTLGMTNKEIAEKLSISYETVKEHVQHILRKIGLTDRTQAAVWAVRNGLV